MNSNNGHRNILTYGSVISFMLDYSESNDFATLSEPNYGNIAQTKEEIVDFLTSRNFLFSHGVFNEFCFFYQFKNKQDLKNNYLNTAFLVLPAFEFDSMNNLNELIKKIQRVGISEGIEKGISNEQLKDCYTRFKQEIQTNHDKSLNLMKKNNNKVNFNDCVQFMHLKSGKFLEYKSNNKNLKTYIQLTNNMSPRTIFRFLPAFNYQSETSTNVFFDLTIQIACGDKKARREKYIVNENVINFGKYSDIKKPFFTGYNQPEEEDEKNNSKIKEEAIPKKSIFDGENLRNTIKVIYNGKNIEDKVIDDFVKYSINENLQQKNLGVKLMPENNYINVDSNSYSFWRLINFSDDYFEDSKYINLFDFFCIQNTDKKLFIQLERETIKDQNCIYFCDLNNTELFPIKEQKEEINENKSDDEKDNNEIINDENNNEIINDENNNESENKNDIIDTKSKLFAKIKSKNNITDSTVVYLDSKIDINYFFDSDFYKNKKYKLMIDSYENENQLKPYSLFKFEPVFEELSNVNFNFDFTPRINIMTDKISIRIINVFTNKVLCVDKIKNNQYKLFLIDEIEKNDKKYKNTIFQIEKIKETHEIYKEERENTQEESKDNIDDNINNKEKNNSYIKKSDYIKIFSKTFGVYIGMRIRNDNNCKELILTSSMSDITRFKLNCLDEEDKYELNFFEQLLWGFNDILKYFKNENRIVSGVAQNYERIKHILITLRNKLNQFYKGDRDVTNLKLQENKFDFMEIIKQFNIVSKLIEIFLYNWFENYHEMSYDTLESKLKTYFAENKDILKYKLLISREILQILSIIYDLNPTYLNVIEDSLLYFFMFVGRDDKCTQFLIHIIKNNIFLLISVCPLKKEDAKVGEEFEKEKKIYEINKSKYNNMKKCLERIINDYNNMDVDKLRINFSSLTLFFNFINNLLTYDHNKPFLQFYDEYFKDLGLLKSIENDQLRPNYENNPIIFDFYLDGDEIYARKIPFADKKKNNNKLIEYKLTDLIDILSNYNIDTEEERYKIILGKLISLNLFFYSFLSICDDKFKKYLQYIFKFENVTKKYLTFNINKIIINNSDNKIEDFNNITKVPEIENPLKNDLKCSIINVITYIYLKIPCPFVIQTHLFKTLNFDKNQEITTIIEKNELKNLVQFISNIFLRENKFDINNINPFCLIQIIEFIQYTLSNIYVMENYLKEEDRNSIYNLIMNILNIFEKFIGLSSQQDPQLNSNEKYLNCLNAILNDKLELKDPIFLVSENFQYVFLKYKKKLEETINRQDEKGNNTQTFLDILRDISDTDRILKNKYDIEKAELTKRNILLLKRFDLKWILMDASINGNRNNKFLKNFTLYLIELIFFEFLNYLEHSTIDELGNNISKDKIIDIDEYENELKKEIINKKYSTKCLDEFKSKNFHDNKFSISQNFFKFLNIVDEINLKNLALQILFRLNSAKKIFYFNIDNLVILRNKEEYNKYIQLRNIILEIFYSLRSFEVIQRIDKNSIYVYNFLKKQLELFLEKLFDEDKWNEQNNALNNDEEDFKFEDSVGIGKIEENDIYSIKSSSKIVEEDADEDNESDKGEDIKNYFKAENKNKNEIVFNHSSESSEIINTETIVNKPEEGIIITSVKDENNKISKRNSKSRENEYFMEDFNEDLLMTQQTLYNLNFIDIICEFFSHIDKLTEIRTEFSGDLLCLEESCIIIYKILVVFICNNENYQSMIKNKLYLFICPLKLKNISDSLLYSINYFLFHLVYNFGSKSDYGKISNIDIVVKRLKLLHQLDWNLHKNVMPYFLKTLRIFFQFSTPECIYDIFQLLDDIKNNVTDDILKGNNNNNSILILTNLLEIIQVELQNKDLKENTRPLLSMSNIIKAFPIMVNYLTPTEKLNSKNLKFSKSLILITNIIFEWERYYKDDLNLYKLEIKNALLNFCNKMVIKDEYIYRGEKLKFSFKFLNEFIGISLPKLFRLLFSCGIKIIEISEILGKSYNLYEKLQTILDHDRNEKIFLEKEHEYDIEIIKNIYNDIGVNFPFLEHNDDNENNDSFDSSNSLVKAKISKKKLENNYRNLSKISTKRLAFDKFISSKKKSFQKNDKAYEMFKNLAKEEIENERKKYILKLFKFFNNKNDNINTNLTFYANYCNSFNEYYKNKLLKNGIFFFYWTNIFLMEFNPKEKSFKEENINNNFEDENPIYNKIYFNDISIINIIIEAFDNINLNINNYENLLNLKFLDSYLFELDEYNRDKFLTKIIEKPESKKIFHLLHNILDYLSNEIKLDLEQKEIKDNFNNKCPFIIFEKDIKEYEIVLKLLCHLSENNEIAGNKMKEYLRLQYNNEQNHNFIIIISNILANFQNNYKLIFKNKYYNLIIKMLEFITKSCSGPCKENQECVVKDKQILNFIKFILKELNYRNKIEDDGGINLPKYEGKEVGENNRCKLSYLKYKVLLLLIELASGRKKGDKIFDSIHQIIKFEVLAIVLMETYKEIVIEKNAKDNPLNFIFEEKMLNRMNNLELYFKDEKKFIIFEIGTFTYILINIYLENLTRLIDLEIYNSIIDIRLELQKNKCNVKSKNALNTTKDYIICLIKCFKIVLGKCGNCFLKSNMNSDFYLKDSFKIAYYFFFEYTPNIEILFKDKIIKYYVKLSPICKCLKKEMKDEFHSKIDRSSAKTKTEYLLNNVEFFRFQLIINKKILDAFSNAPILDLFFNHYKFYRDVFFFLAIVINFLIFMSYYRTNDDEYEVTLKTRNLAFDYGFLYDKNNKKATKIIFLILTIIELVFSALILVNYLIFRVSYLIYYKEEKEETDENDDKEEEEYKKKTMLYFARNGDIFKYLFERLGNFLINVITDIKLIYHLILLVVIICTLITKKYKILSILLIDAIERSSTLMCIVKSFLIPIKKIMISLVLFYLIAYFFIIFVYLYIPDQLPYEDCLRFSNCYFILCDQTIKNSNGIINYLSEAGLYACPSMWSNPRFWIDNWFAILDLMLVLQMLCGIIVDTFLSQREKIKQMEEDKNNVCFICGLNKNDINKYYTQSEYRFNEHIKLDHYLWNYMFAIMNVTLMEKSNFFLDKVIKEEYESNQYSKFIPYKKCLKQLEIELNNKENIENKNEEEYIED